MTFFDFGSFEDIFGLLRHVNIELTRLRFLLNEIRLAIKTSMRPKSFKNTKNTKTQNQFPVGSKLSNSRIRELHVLFTIQPKLMHLFNDVH